MKKNNISLILATKGSGKTILANALALSQEKPVFVITPIKSGWDMQKGDFLNIEEIEELHPNNTYIYEVKYNEFENLLKEITEIKNICVVIDEIDIFSTRAISHQTSLYEIINLGRHNEIDLIALSRRPCDMPTTLRAQADTLYLGRVGKEVNNKKYIKEWIGDYYAAWSENAAPFTFRKIALSSNTNDCFIKLSSELVANIQKYNLRRLKKCDL